MLHALLHYGGFNLNELVFALVAELPSTGRGVSLCRFLIVCVGEVAVVILQDLAWASPTIYAIDYVLVIEAGVMIAGWTHPDSLLVNRGLHMSGWQFIVA